MDFRIIRQARQIRFAFDRNNIILRTEETVGDLHVLTVADIHCIIIDHASAAESDTVDLHVFAIAQHQIPKTWILGNDALDHKVIAVAEIHAQVNIAPWIFFLRQHAASADADIIAGGDQNPVNQRT